MSSKSESLEKEYKTLAAAMESDSPPVATDKPAKKKIIKKPATRLQPQTQSQPAPAQPQSQPAPVNPPKTTTPRKPAVVSRKKPSVTPTPSAPIPPPAPIVQVEKGDDDDDDEPGIGEEPKALGEEEGEGEEEDVELPGKEEEEEAETGVEGEEEEEEEGKGRKKRGGEGEEGEEEEEELIDEPLEEGEEGVKRAVKKKAKNVAATLTADAEDVVEEEEEGEIMDEDYVQRVHPEIVFPDTKELEKILASYVAAENPVIRRSKPILSKYEATSITGMRAQQIVQGSAPLIDTDLENPIDVAIAELKAKILPIIVRRIMADGTAEYWRLSELTYYG